MPNEMFISNRIENFSLADSRLLQSTVVSVAYDSDVELVMRLLSAAALNQDRVLRDPEPGVRDAQAALRIVEAIYKENGR